MNSAISLALRQSLAVVVASALLTACAGDAPLAPPAGQAQLATQSGPEADGVITTLRRVTARYHNLSAALDDEFVLLHPCEARGDEGPVGTVYVHMARLLDGVINPELPDALIYEPSRNGPPKLVGVEFAVPNTGQNPPTFLGTTFQREDEFGVFALHAWVWRANPEGLFAETNPRVSCGAE